MLKELIKKKVLGYSLPQEYACLALEAIPDTLRVTLTSKGSDFFSDVSASHLFLGYKPLVLGIPSIDLPEICLSFHEGNFELNMVWKGFPSSKNSVARLILRKEHRLLCGHDNLFLYEGVWGEHSFINDFHQFINRQKEKYRSDRKVNINLLHNLADQVQVAYSIPRKISVITLCENNTMNMFPTDLHGPVGNDFYIGSLRHGGKANEQVEKIGRVVLSNVDVAWHKQAYVLGKNHMQNLRDSTNFPVSLIKSTTWDYPLPEAVNFYYELETIGFADIGIHRIHNYQIIHKQSIKTGETLSHVHRFYGQWRNNHHKQTKFYWR